MQLLSIRPTMTIKLLASIGVLLAITFVVGGVAIANLGKVERVGEELYSQRLLPLNTADDVQADLIYQRALVFEEMFDARTAQFEGAPRADMLSELGESDDELAGVVKHLDAGLAKLDRADLPTHSHATLERLRASYAQSYGSVASLDDRSGRYRFHTDSGRDIGVLRPREDILRRSRL